MIPDNSTIKENTDTLDLVSQYIVENISNSISLDDLAKVVNSSKFQLIRNFHKEYQTTPAKWLWYIRLRLAATLLKKNNSYSQLEIAETCGFKSLAHYSRAFKKFYGQSPSHFRKDPFSMMESDERLDQLIREKASQALFPNQQKFLSTVHPKDTPTLHQHGQLSP